ncbi:MAG: hypothetical protein KDB82_14780 [Planctomycetes bacterium]|nr:hypothetical protein [Planctomycetota bacterium]
MKVDFSAAWKQHERMAQAVPPKLRATLGGAFTPRAVALRVAHETLSKFPRNDPPTVLDPCCGLGSLLLASVEWACVSRPQWVKTWLQGGKLQGWEISRELADGTKRVLELAGQCLKLPVRPKLVIRDALESDDREITDAILCCPPWKDLSGAAAQDMLPAKRAQIARRFGSFTGTPALHTVFTELAGRLIRRQGGRVGILLPLRVADSPDYAAFRRAMAQFVAPDQIIAQGQGVLPGVNDDAGLFVLTAGKGDVSGEPWESRADEREQVYQTSILRHIPLPPTSFEDIGVNPGNMARQLITDKPEKHAQPIRDASDVIPFAMRKPRLFLRQAGPSQSGRYARVAPAATFKQARIVIKRDAQRPIAAKHNPPAFFRDDLIACFGAPDHDDDFLLGVFNSEYFGRLYRDSFKETRLRAEGRITVEQLRMLPVPSKRAAGAAYSQIIELSRALQKCAGKNPKLLAQLDMAVRKAYTGK